MLVNSSMRSRSCRPTIGVLSVSLVVVALALTSQVAVGSCPEEPTLKNYTGGGTVVCPCFVTGEEAGAVLQAPAEHYPIEILRVGIGWGSVYGGNPQSLEEAIHIYEGGLPNPGTPIFTLEGPVLIDGFVNQFNLEPLPGEIIIDSGPFTVTLEFQNSNAGNPYASSMVHDGNGCQSGKNVVYAIPGGWKNACALGVTGDWVVEAIYRRVNCGAGVEEYSTRGEVAALLRPQPNPFSLDTDIEFVLKDYREVDLSVYDVQGHVVATLAKGVFGPGSHQVSWPGNASDGTPVSSGIYFVAMRADGVSYTHRIVLAR